VNIDLCFVPAEHALAEKLPAVSGSSGRLVVEPIKAEPSATDYPGRIFADESLSYTEAMLEFVSRSQVQTEPTFGPSGQTQTDQSDVSSSKRTFRRQAAALRAQRRQVREQRGQEDQAWQQLKAQHRTQQVARKQRQLTGVKAAWGSQKAQDELWHQLRQQRRSQLAQRQQEDQHWRQQRHSLRQQALELPSPASWIAILVMTDNCTRQCLGLPLFVAGARVTAEMVVEALRTLLPPELQFLISDRGTHFTADLFKQLARDEQFIHVLIARHRPQSNGIAERFVRSLKEWLRDKTWSCSEELSQLLARFMTEYNDRPHQGLPIPGLSPNVFAERFWLF
jgi:transposase InsO family protein